jgi:hypothetical protein
MWAPTEAGRLASGASATHERVDERPESRFPGVCEIVPGADDGFVGGDQRGQVERSCRRVDRLAQAHELIIVVSDGRENKADHDSSHKAPLANELPLERRNSDISGAIGLGGCHARELADDGNGQARIRPHDVLEAGGGYDEKSDAIDGQGRGRVRRVAKQGHLAEQIPGRERPKKPLTFWRSPADLNGSVVNEVGFSVSGRSLTKDLLSCLEDPGLHTCDLMIRSCHLWSF